MADQQYRRPSSPGRAKRGFSDASISLSPFGGSTPGSALGQSSDLLGLPGSTSMPIDFASVPRTLSSTTHHTRRGSNNPYNTGLFLDGDSDHRPLASDTSAAQWAPTYTLQPGNINTIASSAIPIHRFQSEPQTSWTALRIAPPLRPSSGTVQTHPKLGPRLGPKAPFPPGPGSDLVSRTNETDEGYYSTSQPDAQSVHSMGPWNLNQDTPNAQRGQFVVPFAYTPPEPANPNQDTQNAQRGQFVVPFAYPPPGPGNPDPEQPDSDLQHDELNTTHAGQSPHRPKSLVCRHEACEYMGRTQSDLKKHAARHEREYVCREIGCTRAEGFATINDLERHQKSVHKIQPEHGNSREYKCFGESCSKHEKEWPRFDNFKQHLKRMHRNQNLETLIARSNEWYEQHKQPQATPVVHAAQRPSSSNSLQATAQNAVQMGAPSLTPKHLNQRITPNGGRGTTSTGPTGTFGPTYPQSEAGNYSTSFSGSHTSPGMSRPSTGDMQLRSNFARCPTPGCSQSFRTANHLREHLRSQHGSQRGLAPYYLTMQGQGSSWSSNQSNPGNQLAIPSRQCVSTQESGEHATRALSPYQIQTRVMNGAYGPRTAPNPSIPTIQTRLEEDFDSSAMMQPQDALFGAGNTDILLAQIGMMPQFQPEVSQTTNLGFDTSQEQGLNIQEDPQTKPTPPLSIDAVKAFLREHYPDDRIDLVATVVQNALQSLQSTSSSGDMDDTLAPTALKTDNFEYSIQGEKRLYHCPKLGCGKAMPRKCELRKHLQRHTLPWACTFDNCRRPYRYFGSKNDWKRHELKQHEQQELWRCEEQHSNTTGRSVPAVGDDACMKTFCTKDLYRNHLNDQHHISDGCVINKLCKSQRIGAKCKDQYWCGFCNRIVVLTQRGLEGDSERYNHIDQHFTKERRHISKWKPLNGRPSPGDSALASGHTSAEESSSTGSDEVETFEDTAAEAQAIQNMPTSRDGRKRPAPMMAAGDRGPASKVARTVGPRAHTVRSQMSGCCQCQTLSQSWNGACTGCNHQFCRNCSTEMVKQTEHD